MKIYIAVFLMKIIAHAYFEIFCSIGALLQSTKYLMQFWRLVDILQKFFFEKKTIPLLTICLFWVYFGV